MNQIKQKKLVKKYLSISLDEGKTFTDFVISNWLYTDAETQIKKYTFNEFWDKISSQLNTLEYNYFSSYQTMFTKRRRIQTNFLLFDLVIKEELTKTIIIKEEYKQEYKPTMRSLFDDLNSNDFLQYLKDNQIQQIVIK